MLNVLCFYLSSMDMPYLSRHTKIFLVFKTHSRAAHMHSYPTLLKPHTLHYETEEEINFRRETDTGFETKLDIWI